MDKIRIGNGPDFCMVRGKELLNYKAKIFVLSGTKEPIVALISDRSFAMVLKTVIQFVLPFYKGGKIEFEVLKNQNVLEAQFCGEYSVKVSINLHLPKELSGAQLNDINKEFIKHSRGHLKRG